MTPQFHMSLDADSPEARKARADALQLVAARLGGKDTYLSTWNELFGGPRDVSVESVTYLAYLADALSLVAMLLIRVATEEFEAAEKMRAAVSGDPQQLMAFVDGMIERMIKKDGDAA